MEQYRVLIVSASELPTDVDWLFVRQDGCLQFWLRESVAGTPATLVAALEGAWQAFRDIADDKLLSWSPDLLAS